MKNFICKYCNEIIQFDEDEFDLNGSYHPDGEEMLWDHIQTKHPDVFKNIQDFETPFMILECYNM